MPRAILAGFFGIGGGFLVVPGIIAATDMPLIFAVGSSLVSVSAFGLTTAGNYAISGLIDWVLVAYFIVWGGPWRFRRASACPDTCQQ